MEKRAEILCALFLLLLGIGFSIKAWNIPEPLLMQSVNTPPNFFPILTGLIFTTFAFIHLLTAIVSYPPPDANSSETFLFCIKRLKPAFPILIILLFYIILINYLGWLICTFFMAFGVLLVAEKAITGHRRVKRSLVLALLLTGLTYLIFGVLLGVMLPDPELWGLENLIYSF